jgi:hypothetical protein
MKAPIFEKIFKDKWAKLPEVFKQHYAISAYSDDKVEVQGTLNISYIWWLKFLSPLFGWLHTLPPWQGQNIPTTVTYRAAKDIEAFCFDRVIQYPNRKPFLFQSKMIPMHDNVLIELTPCGLGWKFAYDFQDNQVTLTQLAYVFKFYSWIIPLPLGLLMGKGFAFEEALSSNTFKMSIQFSHPWFGTTYEYYGIFQITQVQA